MHQGTSPTLLLRLENGREKINCEPIRPTDVPHLRQSHTQGRSRFDTVEDR
jgi:hypothetical protein